MKKNIILSAALMFFGLTAQAQTKITFDADDYKKISVYDSWEQSPFRTGVLEGNAAVATNPDTEVDAILGSAPNTTGKVVALQRSRHGSNTYGVRIDLKEPIRVTKQLQYIHIMTYLKDKPADSRMMVIGLGKRLEESWSWQTGEDEQFWSTTTSNVKPKAGWQDVVVSFKGFSYSKEENTNSGIDIHSLVIVPDVRSPHADETDWVAYFDEIVIDNNPDKRFTTEAYALAYDEETNVSRTDRGLTKVGLTVGDKTYSSATRSGKLYANNTATHVFSATAGAQVQPTFGYSGNWMSGYVYVDWGNDGIFNDTIASNGIPAEGSDVVSHNAIQIGDSWYKSDGTTVSNGNTIGSGVPQFTVPENTPVGLYRMRYKVDWNCIDPAGNVASGNTILGNGGGIVDIMLDVHGDKVSVNASQLNGDIVLAADESPLQGYVMDYETPLTVKIVPAPGFVQYGFTLKYGYNVNAKEQFDDYGNPNYIKVNVPYTEIAADGTYTIPAEYMRGAQVNIVGDMQQVWQYKVTITGADGGVSYANTPIENGGIIYATQFFSADQVVVTPVEGYTYEVIVDKDALTVNVVYTESVEDETPRVVTAITEGKRYTLECRSGHAHSTERYIGVTDDGVVSGQSSAATYLTFEAAENIANGYYIKIDAIDKYLNHDGSNISASAEKKTVWTLGAPSHTAGVVTFSIGNDKYLNNNGSDCTDGTCTSLKANYHSGGPGAGNACSLWEMYEYSATPDDDTAIEEVVVGKTCYKGFYNLQGQKLNDMPTSGIVIVDGQKVLIK